MRFQINDDLTYIGNGLIAYKGFWLPERTAQSFVDGMRFFAEPIPAYYTVYLDKVVLIGHNGNTATLCESGGKEFWCRGYPKYQELALQSPHNKAIADEYAELDAKRQPFVDLYMAGAPTAELEPCGAIVRRMEEITKNIEFIEDFTIL